MEHIEFHYLVGWRIHKLPVIDGRGTRPVVQSGDLAFLEEKAKNGNLITVNGSATSGEITSFVVPSGKTFHLVSSKCTFQTTGSALTFPQRAHVQLNNNGTVIEDFHMESDVMASGSGVGAYGHAEYLGVVKGDILIGDGIKKYSLDIISATTTTVRATITGYLTDTNSQSFGGQTVTFNTADPFVDYPVLTAGLTTHIKIPVKDNPIYKYFTYTTASAISNGGPAFVTETAEWSSDYKGAIGGHIQAGANEKLLCIFQWNTSGSTSSSIIHASDTLDTADGTLFTTGAGQTTRYPEKVFILDNNQFLTIAHTTNAGGFNRNSTISGFTTPLPDDFSLT